VHIVACLSRPYLSFVAQSHWCVSHCFLLAFTPAYQTQALLTWDSQAMRINTREKLLTMEKSMRVSIPSGQTVCVLSFCRREVALPNLLHWDIGGLSHVSAGIASPREPHGISCELISGRLIANCLLVACYLVNLSITGKEIDCL
jgi:hypothetical protein